MKLPKIKLRINIVKKYKRINLYFLSTLLLFVAYSCYPQENPQLKFIRGCNEIFKDVDGCLGLVNMNSMKISVTIREDILYKQFFKPGSIFKIISAITAILSGKITPSTEYNCRGSVLFNEKKYRCWLPGGHKKINLTDAIAQSCNVFFYHVADNLTLDEFYNIAEIFYIGKRTPFQIEGESPGIFNKSNVEDSRYDIALGQSDDILVTPVQMLYLISVIASRGKFPGCNLDLAAKNFSPLFEGLCRSVRKGTAKESMLVKYDIAGKTGTSSKKIGIKTNSWFVGFAPFDNPEISLVIFLKHGRGSTDAAPLAKKVFKKYFEIYHPH